MVVVYVALIVAGRKTYAQVPAILKDAVKAELIALDLAELADLALKADKTYVDSQDALKANSADVALKADKT